MNRILPENWRIIFAKNVLNERERLGFTQKDLADKLGMSSGSAISEWESGRGRARMDIFAELCELFERNPNDLMTIDLSTHPPPPPLPTGKLKPIPAAGVGERDVGATESPPAPEGGANEVKAMKRQMLEMMLKLEEMDAQN